MRKNLWIEPIVSLLSIIGLTLISSCASDFSGHVQDVLSANDPNYEVFYDELFQSVIKEQDNAFTPEIDSLAVRGLLKVYDIPRCSMRIVEWRSYVERDSIFEDDRAYKAIDIKNGVYAKPYECRDFVILNKNENNSTAVNASEFWGELMKRSYGQLNLNPNNFEVFDFTETGRPGVFKLDLCEIFSTSMLFTDSEGNLITEGSLPMEDVKASWKWLHIVLTFGFDDRGIVFIPDSSDVELPMPMYIYGYYTKDKKDGPRVDRL